MDIIHVASIAVLILLESIANMSLHGCSTEGHMNKLHSICDNNRERMFLPRFCENCEELVLSFLREFRDIIKGKIQK